MLNHVSLVFDRHYVGVSPQLLARVRQRWSAEGLDLDAAWRASVASLPGFADLDGLPAFPDSRPVDLVLLFDQACCWADALRATAGALRDHDGAGRLTGEQRDGLTAVTARLRESAAAVRMLSLAGLSRPGMQLARSVSEDVDLALALLVRRKLARAFVACRSPEDAAEFWRRHVSGGRAFRLVAQALYQFGLNYGEDSEYARWRREVLVFLGSAVHTSYVGAMAGESAARSGPLNPAAQECLYFATIRMQELCAYAIALGADLRADIATLPPATGLAAVQRALVLRGGSILTDQMRWLTQASDDDRSGPSASPPLGARLN